jgi:hypothetical protein
MSLPPPCSPDTLFDDYTIKPQGRFRQSAQRAGQGGRIEAKPTCVIVLGMDERGTQIMAHQVIKLYGDRA